MAIVQLLTSVNPLSVVAAVAASLLLFVWCRNRIADVRIRRAGGTRAWVLAGNPLSVFRHYYDAGKSQYYGSFAEWCNGTLDKAPSGRGQCVEFSLTGGKRVLITREPEQIKTILATKFADFGHGPQWHRLWYPFLGNGIFATDGQQWHDSRGMIRPMFVKDRLRDLAIFDGCTEKLISKLPASGSLVDVKDLFYRWSLDTTTEFLLGENVNSLDHPNHEVARAISVAQRIQMLIFVLNPVAPLIPKGEYLTAIEQMERFIEPIIARTVALRASEVEDLSKLDEDFSFLHSICRFTRDPKDIRDQIMSVLLAGRDTTAATLSWAMYELSTRPEIWAKLRTEVLGVLGRHGKPTYETLKDLQYVKYTLNETLRLHPAVPVNMRQALRTTSVPGPPGEPDIVLLKGDTVTMHTIGMHLRKDIYPPTTDAFADPSEFSPDRWETWTPKPWTYIPFHGGPRICVGQNFALTEMAYCLVRLLQKFERIEYRGDWAAQTLKADIIGTPALGVPVALFEDKS